MTNLPTSTYRLQFNKKFNFNSARKLLPYLKKLGISHIYASPIFKASEGSVHGYDVVDPTQLSTELGKSEDFNKLIVEAREKNIGWLQDIVPNHMAFDFENKMLVDLLENGPDSQFFNYFDVEWGFGHFGDKPRMLAPFLGKYYQESLEDGEILLAYDEEGFSINYYDRKFPVKVNSYNDILSPGIGKLQNKVGRNYPAIIKLLGLLHIVKSLPSYENNDERYHQIKFIKSLLWELYSDDEQVRVFINETIKNYNGIKGKSESFDLMDKLLSDQYYRLAYWKVANEEINYRRFFNISSLISLKVENEEVFNRTHSLIFKLLKEEKIDGLRVDHIDGLYDPEVYLKRIREGMGKGYLVVEKILEDEEQIPITWPIEGTTGYDFLNLVNGLFCQSKNEHIFSRIYATFTQNAFSFNKLVVEKKKLIIRTRMAGELQRLSLLVEEIAKQDRYGADITLNGIKAALEEILVHFSIYRTYVSGKKITDQERDYINKTIRDLKNNFPRIEHEINYIGLLLTMQHIKLSEELYGKSINFIMKFQQLTGPLMAKGFEDTVLYIYNRLISLNEVGGNPSKFGITLQEFHKNIQERGKWKFSLNTTSTHDTKRGEDVRSRINVLSEIPDEWNARIKKWRNINKKYKQEDNGKQAPDNNDEYFLYQTLIGALPFDYEKNGNVFLKRIKEYAIKSVREAKIYTAWVKPDEYYENAYMDFIEKILTKSEQNLFLKDIIEFNKYISFYGIFNSLSQTLIKMTTPGIPDFYQGSELWDLSLVDPDNRRPVNFIKRRKILSTIEETKKRNKKDLFKYLLSTPETGAIKLFLIQQILQARKQYQNLFEEGSYQQLNASGKFKESIISFIRRNEREFLAVITIRYLTNIVKKNELPLKDVWENTSIFIPFQTRAITNLITEENLDDNQNLRIGEILSEFPVAVIKGDITG